MLCRYHADLYKPRVKMRDKYLRTSGHTRLAICTRGDTIDMHMKQVIEQATTCHHVAMWKWDQAGHATHVVWKSNMQLVTYVDRHKEKAPCFAAIDENQVMYIGFGGTHPTMPCKSIFKPNGAQHPMHFQRLGLAHRAHPCGRKLLSSPSPLASLRLISYTHLGLEFGFCLV